MIKKNLYGVLENSFTIFIKEPLKQIGQYTGQSQTMLITLNRKSAR
jgi:hypothetical protein